jgi:hypothetical protein
MAIGPLSQAIGKRLTTVVFTGGRKLGQVTAKNPYGATFGNNEARIAKILDGLGLDPAETKIVHGAANGLDSVVDRWAKARGFQVVPVRAEWEAYGKRAGFIRNRKMLEDYSPELVIAFPGGPGTKGMTDITNRAKVPLFQIDNAAGLEIEKEGFSAVARRIAAKYAPAARESVARGVAPQASVASIISKTDADFRFYSGKLAELLKDDTINPKFAQSWVDQTRRFINRNPNLPAEQLDELNKLLASMQSKSDPRVAYLREFEDALDDLLSKDMKQKEMAEAYKELNTMLLEHVDTINGDSFLTPFISATLAKFGQAGRSIGTLGSKGGVRSGAARQMEAKADDLLGAVEKPAPIKVRKVKKGKKGVADSLDQYADINIDADTLADAKKGIGIGFRGLDEAGEKIWDISPEDVIQIHARQEEVSRLGAGRMSRTEQSAIDKLNREVFSEEASVDKFIDRDTPFSRMIDEIVGRSSNSVDDWEMQSRFRKELEQALRTGDYREITSKISVMNAIKFTDEGVTFAKGGKQSKMTLEVKRKVRTLKDGSQQTFHTEIYHEGRRLNGDEIRAAFGACPRCGIVYPIGLPGVCTNPLCLSGGGRIREVAKKTENPAEFIQGIRNFIGEGPEMTKLKETISINAVRKVIVLGEPGKNFSRQEIARLVESMNLPLDVKVVVPLRGGVEYDVKLAFMNRNAGFKARYRQRIARISKIKDPELRQKLLDELEGITVPDSNIDFMRMTSDVDMSTLAPFRPRTRDFSSRRPQLREYEPGIKKVSNQTMQQLEVQMTPDSVAKHGETLLLTFGDSQDIRAANILARRMSSRQPGVTVINPVRVINVGDSATSPLLNELRPKQDVLRFIGNNLDEEAGSLSAYFDDDMMRQFRMAKDRLARVMRGYTGDKFAPRESWITGKNAWDEYGQMLKAERYINNIKNARARLATDQSKRAAARDRRIVKTSTEKLFQNRTRDLEIPRRFGEGIVLPRDYVSKLPEGGYAARVESRRELLERLARVERAGRKPDGSKLTPEEMKDLRAWIKDMEANPPQPFD